MENKEIRDAFKKVKQDITFLDKEIKTIKSDISNIYAEFSNFSSNIDNIHFELNELKMIIKNLHEELNNQKLYEIAKTPVHIMQKSRATDQQTNQQINQTDSAIPTQNPTIPHEIKGLKDENITISTGNEGVPTDQQTIKQTSRQTNISTNISLSKEGFNYSEPNIETNLKEAKIILDSLDRLKKEIRQKFKRLTSQEMIVFSTIYQLEESDPENNTYREIAKKLKLSESSIRDYTLRIISKGIPIKKRKINNKKVILFVSPELKNIATLSTIIQLRDL